MPQREKPIRRTVRIGVLLAAAAALALAVPRPLVSRDAFIPTGSSLKVWRAGDFEVCEVDEALAAELLACLRQYTATPVPTKDYYPRQMSKIPFELELACFDGRGIGRDIKHFVLGKDFFWYSSSFPSLPYVIRDGQALMDQIAALAGVSP